MAWWLPVGLNRPHVKEWALRLAITGGVSLALLGVRLLSQAWIVVGSAMLWSGLEVVVIASLLYLRWWLMTFRCWFPTGHAERLPRKQVTTIMYGDYDVYLDLCARNPGLEMWHMMPDFPPFLLRRIVLRRVTIRVPWLASIAAIAVHARILPEVAG